MGLSSVSDEAIQVMREELFVRSPGVVPRISNYSGRGDLRRWLRAVVGRTGLRLVAKRHPVQSPLQGSGAIAAEGDVEMDYLKRTYGAAFQLAFREALDSMPPKDRLLLKLRLRHGLGLEEIAAMNGVHFSTVSRWVADARERLVTATRERMMNNLKVGRAEADSILRLIQSQIDVTLSSMAPVEPSP
jgi:RNA polymerase sigma-70 factor (ECF subfamily)